MSGPFCPQALIVPTAPIKISRYNNARGLIIRCMSSTQFNNSLSNQLIAIVAVNGLKVINYAILALALLVYCGAAQAQFPVRNYNPFAVYVGLPELKTAKKLTTGQQELTVNTTVSSHFVIETDERDPLYLDGETTVADLVWRRGFADVELELTLPYVKHQQGYLDSFIIDWHEVFDLPGADRNTVKNNQLFYSYQDKKLLQLEHTTEGVGDVRVNVGKQLELQADYQHAIHLLLKLPTGDSKKWLGSGSTDLAFYTTHAWLLDRLLDNLLDNWTAQAQLGMIVMEEPDMLAKKRRKVAMFGSAAFGYIVMQGWQLIVQYDAHSPLYKNSKQNQLGDGQAITVGSQWQGKHWGLHMAVIEDIKVDSVPDVGFQLGIKWIQ